MTKLYSLFKVSNLWHARNEILSIFAYGKTEEEAIKNFKQDFMAMKKHYQETPIDNYSRKEHTEHKDIKRIMDNLEWVD